MMNHPIQEQLESEVGTVVVIECALNLSQQFIQKCILYIWYVLNIHYRYIYNVSHKYIYIYSLCVYIYTYEWISLVIFQPEFCETSNLQAKADEETYEAWRFFCQPSLVGESRLRFKRLYGLWKGCCGDSTCEFQPFDMFQPPFVDQHVSPKKGGRWSNSP